MALEFSRMLIFYLHDIFNALGIFMVFIGMLTIGTMLAIYSYAWVLLRPVDKLINFIHLYCNEAQIEMIREVFFMSMNFEHRVTIPKKGDFMIDDKYLFEVGGKNKSFKQIKNLPNSFVVADDIEIGSGNKIPLWLFGFLY
jgi:hypothetical protein